MVPVEDAKLELDDALALAGANGDEDDEKEEPGVRCPPRTYSLSGKDYANKNEATRMFVN